MAKAKTVMVVDDDPDIVETTRLALESAGYDVMTAGDGTEALEKLKKRKPDLIILDIMMARLTEGFDLSYQLRKDPQLSRIPIIIVSGISSKTGFDFASEKETDYIKAEDFLEKPVSMEVLLKRVAEVIAQGPRPDKMG